MFFPRVTVAFSFGYDSQQYPPAGPTGALPYTIMLKSNSELLTVFGWDTSLNMTGTHLVEFVDL
jgi:hypothetical protein